MKVHPIWFIITLVLSSCNVPASTPNATSVSQPAPSATSSPAQQPIPANTAPSLSLDVKPLVWFAPLPPLVITDGRNFTGSDDFMGLFEPEAPWQNAAEHVQVFKLYGEWVAYKATDAQLKQVVEDLNRRGIALAVEAGPLNAPSDCGQGVEGFAGTEEVSGSRNASKTLAAR